MTINCICLQYSLIYERIALSMLSVKIEWNRLIALWIPELSEQKCHNGSDPLGHQVRVYPFLVALIAKSFLLTFFCLFHLSMSVCHFQAWHSNISADIIWVSAGGTDLPQVFWGAEKGCCAALKCGQFHPQGLFSLQSLLQDNHEDPITCLVRKSVPEMIPNAPWFTHTFYTSYTEYLIFMLLKAKCELQVYKCNCTCK